jgi:hypothetical protein
MRACPPQEKIRGSCNKRAANKKYAESDSIPSRKISAAAATSVPASKKEAIASGNKWVALSRRCNITENDWDS